MLLLHAPIIRAERRAQQFGLRGLLHPPRQKHPFLCSYMRPGLLSRSNQAFTFFFREPRTGAQSEPWLLPQNPAHLVPPECLRPPTYHCEGYIEHDCQQQSMFLSGQLLRLKPRKICKGDHDRFGATQGSGNQAWLPKQLEAANIRRVHLGK